jgi:hypothetical protein
VRARLASSPLPMRRSIPHTSERGVSMFKQMRLEFLNEEHLDKLWEGFPEARKHELTQQLARLMARTAVQCIRALRTKQEAGDEPRHG